MKQQNTTRINENQNYTSLNTQTHANTLRSAIQCGLNVIFTRGLKFRTKNVRQTPSITSIAHVRRQADETVARSRDMFRSRSAPGPSSSQHPPVSPAAPLRLNPQPPQQPQPLVNTNNNAIESSASLSRKNPRDAVFNREANSVASSSFVPASQYRQSKRINRAGKAEDLCGYVPDATTPNITLEIDWTREYTSDTEYTYHEVIEEVAEEFCSQTPESEDNDESDEDTIESVVPDSYGGVPLTKLGPKNFVKLWNPITEQIPEPTPRSCLNCGQALDWGKSGMLRPGFQTYQSHCSGGCLKKTRE
ncbi:hypothetical protein HK100_003804 [Physocladia obscura]|uniref:Uncharacterized protein n=1 Tax=Physocladia obscura TaxID=109957 RepID=A0AAD5T7D5_9FUNG|nr:hypothetical protein HK100_003804 [Physocladia obscura]